jgi:hypothetical protein
MGNALRQLIDVLETLPEESREAWARAWLAELAVEREWARRFARDAETIARLADNARCEYDAEAPEPLDRLLRGCAPLR